MAKNKPFIGIKRIWYGEPLAEPNTPAKLAAWLKTATEVLNSHEGTWGYSQDDPSVTEYKNELNGQVYYRDKTDEGAKTITFSIGVYSWNAQSCHSPRMAALQSNPDAHGYCCRFE